MCGADPLCMTVWDKWQGSPPRVRSRRVIIIGDQVIPGITSACAEQTANRCKSARGARDHLRVCGADAADLHMDAALAGSPPRVRSRLGRAHVHRPAIGITSACAEQTRG